MSLEALSNFVGGWCAGIAGMVSGHPLDTVKVRQQTAGGQSGAWNCILETYKFEGIRGFYKGMLFPILSIGTMNAIYFGIYSNTIRALMSWRHGNRYAEPTMWDIYLAGCNAGLGQVFVACPTDFIKVKLQIQKENADVLASRLTQRTKQVYTGPWHCLVTSYRRNGIRGCNKGFICQLVRDTPSSGIYIVVYEYICKVFSRVDGSVSPLVTMLAGGAAGSISWTVIMPLDVVKSRIQGDDFQNPRYRGMLHCVSECYRQGGLRIFFRGTTVCAVRAFPVNAVIFLTYEMSLKLMKNYVL